MVLPNQSREGGQQQFHPVSPQLAPIFSYVASSGRTIHYTTIGPKNGWPVLEIDGNPENAEMIGLLAPYEPMLAQLGLRVIHPERIGVGITPYIPCDPANVQDCITPDKYASDWSDLMHSFGYHTYSVLAFSNGGPYADFFMKSHWQEVRSLHLSSALDTSGTWHFCPMTQPLGLRDALQPYIENPSSIWTLFPGQDFDIISSIPGLVEWFDRAIAASPDATGASYDVFLACNFPVGDLSAVRTPVFIYHGTADVNVPFSMALNHRSEYPNVVEFDVHENRAHLQSLRFVGQTLLDIAQPDHHMRLICDLSQKGQSSGKTRIVDDAIANQLLSQGKAIEDICAWVGTPGQ